MPFFGVPIRNGLPIGLGSVAGFGVQQFDPSQLFEGGTVAGAWYDPSDLSTMFDTSTGTTPVAMPGQGAAVPVGLMLDKSQGLVLGSELVTNGTFDANINGWTAGTGGTGTIAWSSGGILLTTGTDGIRAVTSIATVAGKSYKVEVSRVAGGSAATTGFRATTSSDGSVVGALQSVTGITSATYTRSLIFTASGATTYIALLGGSSLAETAVFDNISVRELPGNHAIAFNNTTARPELRARVNLLTYSEEFTNSDWAKSSGVTITPNTATSPIGTLTADTYTPPNTLDARIRYTTAQSASTTHNASVYAKAINGTWLRIRNLASNSQVWFDLSSGVVGTQTGGTGTIENAGNGWWKCTNISTTPASIASNLLDIGSASGDNTNITNGTETVYIWGADLRPANIGANVPAYQRIADANTYDTSGFPLYLRFDGTDDSMYTPANLNLSGTDKVTVFAGVRKLSDAAAAVLVELSANWGSNTGAFIASAPNSTGANGDYAAGSRGTAAAALNQVAFAVTLAPITNVYTATHDIAGDLSAIRLNGAASGTNGTGDKGTGNFGTYPLYIGSRNNSSLWLNAQLYSLIIAGSAVSAGNISATEQWVAGKTGLALP